MSIITLTHGQNVVRLAPEAGGGIAGFRSAGRDILRSAMPGAVEARDPLGLACFPMTPFVNRIRNGRFTFGDVRTMIEQPGLKHALHGQGWRLPWRLVESDEVSAELECEAGGDAWPWRYSSRQRFALSEHGLTVELDIENRSSTEMPASLGLHPYFPDLATASLKAATSGMWATDEELMLTEWRPRGAAPSFENFSALAGTDLDNCFTGFDGEAVIRWRDGQQVRLLGEGCKFMQIYTRGNDGSFCVEAQTAMPDGLNRLDDPDSGISIVQPGETFSCLTRFIVEAV